MEKVKVKGVVNLYNPETKTVEQVEIKGTVMEVWESMGRGKYICRPWVFASCPSCGQNLELDIVFVGKDIQKPKKKPKKVHPAGGCIHSPSGVIYIQQTREELAKKLWLRVKRNVFVE